MFHLNLDQGNAWSWEAMGSQWMEHSNGVVWENMGGLKTSHAAAFCITRRGWELHSAEVQSDKGWQWTLCEKKLMSPSNVEEKKLTWGKKISNMKGKRRVTVHSNPKIMCIDRMRDHKILMWEWIRWDEKQFSFAGVKFHLMSCYQWWYAC